MFLSSLLILVGVGFLADALYGASNYQLMVDRFSAFPRLDVRYIIALDVLIGVSLVFAGVTT